MIAETATTDARHCVVAALAGRRIDAPDAEKARFPLGRAPAVRNAIAETIKREAIGLLVCSAACGADLLALDVALDSGVRCRVVLPFNPVEFRRTSVTDRPGDWGPLYDRVIATVATANDLIVLDGRAEDEGAYSQANEAIIHEATLAASPNRAVAILVWEGQPREGSDATAEFRQLAVSAGMDERTVLTCGE